MSSEMHEFALTDDLLKLAREEAERAGLERLDKIVVRIGGLSGVFSDSIEFAFEFLRKESEITKDTELIIEHVDGKAKCSKCGKTFTLDRLFLYCPECETPTLEIIEGKDFLLARLEGEIREDEGDSND